MSCSHCAKSSGIYSCSCGGASYCGSICQKVEWKLLTCICGGVSYCGSSCQKADWKRHKPNCPPYKIQEIPGKGKGMVATRNIKPGTVIIEETPLFSKIQKDKFQQICQLLQLSQSLPDYQKQKVLSLHDPGENSTQQSDINRVELIEGKDYSVDSLKLARIALVNIIEVSNEDDVIGGALYENLSRINHSCTPNCIWFGKKDNVYVKEVRAVKNIEKGEEIVASYIDAGAFMLKAERKERLKCWNFECSCKICSLEGEELKKNEELRLEIMKQNEIKNSKIDNFAETLSAAKLELDLMLKMEDEAILKLPEAYLQLFELFFMLEKTANETGLNFENLDEKNSEYKKRAFELAQIFGDPTMFAYERKLFQLSQL